MRAVAAATRRMVAECCEARADPRDDVNVNMNINEEAVVSCVVGTTMLA